MALPRQVNQPIGTLDEIIANGDDPEYVACCHKPAKDGSIKGCQVWDTCRFNLRNRNGGKWTKGEGPHYVGYYVHVGSGEGNGQKEDFMTCHNFVKDLEPRMLTGRAAQERGERDYETIEVIGQEGDKIFRQDWKSVAADGGNRSGDLRIKAPLVEVTIPTFPRPGEIDTSKFDGMLRKRAAERAAAREQREATVDERRERLGGVEEPSSEPVTTPPVAEPVRRSKA